MLDRFARYEKPCTVLTVFIISVNWKIMIYFGQQFYNPWTEQFSLFTSKGLTYDI